MMSFRHFLAICLGYGGAISGLHAQPVDFVCPPAGTVEQRAVTTIKYTGVSAGDPYVCGRLNPWGKPEERLFNYYTLSTTNATAVANAPARAGLIDLLSGRKSSVSFPYTATNGYIMQETWTFLRKERFTLGDKTYDTIVLGHETVSDPRGRSDFHGRYTSWLDPKTGLWLRMDLSVISGSVNLYPAAYVDHAITLP